MEIPIIADKPLGPVHSIVCDNLGRVFLSDEINHRVLCVTEKGEPLWWRGHDSSEAIQFRYPRGLALGRVRVESTGLADCIAICDSWNNRIVFLNLQGAKIGEWKSAGDRSLHEVSDIRYVRKTDQVPWIEGEHNYWLVLDRGNHRVCWLSENGELLRQVGQLTIPWIQEHSKSVFSERLIELVTSQAPDPVSPFNFLYYPTRLLEGPGLSHVVVEPLHQSLKLIHHGSLFPLLLNRKRYRWLAVAHSGFLGWDETEQILALVSLDGTETLRISVDGNPVCAGREKNEWWEQQGQFLIRHTVSCSFTTDPKRTGELQPELLLGYLTETEINSAERDQAANVLDPYFESLKKLLRFADEIALIMGSGTPQTPANDFQQLVDEMLQDLQLRAEQVKRTIDNVCCSVLRLRIINSKNSFAEFGSSVRQIQNRFENNFVALAESLDRIVLAKDEVTGKIGPQPDWVHQLEKTRSKLHTQLWPIGNFIGQCFDLLERSLGSSPELIDAEKTVAAEQSRGFRSHMEALEEVDRWPIDDKGGLHRYPCHVALSNDRSINVAFRGSNSILELGRRGNFLRNLVPPAIPGIQAASPNGIAWDQCSRLWLTHGASKCVLIWDVSHNSIQMVKGIDAANKFNIPYAICQGVSGEMLLCDFADHNVIKISYDGRCKYLAGGKGTEPGQFINPCSLTTDPDPSVLWVVDHRNHRLQRLGLSGEFIYAIGRCGLKRGEMALPLSATVFPDGILAVSMWHLSRFLLLVSAKGEELGRRAIDFIPGGMLVMENRLFVTDCERNQIRIYERR